MKYRELRKALRAFGIREDKRRGKGSHRIFYHPDYEGKPRFVTVPCHNENAEVAPSILESVLDCFGLKQDPKGSTNLVRDVHKRFK